MCRFSRVKTCGFFFALLLLAPEVLWAQWIDLENFFYRDFLDLGQNRGQFQAGTTNLTLQSAKNPNVSVNFPFEIPSFSARNDNGNMTAIGRGFATTANHVKTFDNCTQNPNICTWGQTTYSVSGSSGAYGNDTRFVRMDKFIVEGSMPLLDTGITGTTQSNTGYSDATQANKQKLLERLKAMQDSNGNVYLLQAGSGLLRIESNYTGSLSGQEGSIFDINGGYGISGLWGMKGGAFGTVYRSGNCYDENNCHEMEILYKRNPQNSSIFGMTFKIQVNTDMLNNGTVGDSGSGYYVYDSQKKQWYLLGVDSESDGRSTGVVSFVAQSDFDDYKKQFEQTINLQNSDWTLNGKSLNVGVPSDNATLQDNKDIILQGGGKIEVQSDLTLNQKNGNTMQSGGLVFMAKDGASADKPTIYTITQGSGNYKYYGAGLDIAENVKVNWNLGVYGPLHKVGAGTLEITTYDSTNNGASKPPNGTNGAAGNYELLRLGEGKVILNSNRQVFSSAYITSGRGTLELVKGKGEALGATKDSANGANSYKLEQSKNDNMGFTFGNGGGNLDLKGNSFTLNTISSNDARANIINSDTDASTMTIQGYGYDKDGNKENKAADTIIHASFGQNTSTNSKAANANNNIKLVYKNDTRPVDSKGEGSAALIFDGNVDVKSLESTNGNIVLQGHPTTHAYINLDLNSKYADELKTKLLQWLKLAEDSTGGLPNWMDLTRPSTLEQPDWDYRIFKIGSIDLKGSHLSVGRAAIVQGNITADSGSKIKLGGDVKHYIDKKDGENTQLGGTSYKQEMESNTLSEPSQLLANAQISYEGKITATGSTIESKIFDFNANLDLKDNAKLSADYLTLEERAGSSGAVASLSGNNTTANVKHILFKNIKDESKINVSGGAKFSITNSITLENSKVSLTNFDFSTIGNMLVNNSSTATLNSGVGNYNLIVAGGSTFHNTGNDFALSSGKQVSISGESTMKIGSTSGNGTIQVKGNGTATADSADSKAQSSHATQNTTGNTLNQNAGTESSPCQSAQDLSGCLPSDKKPLDSVNQPEPSAQTIIAVEKGSKLELASFKADNGANVYLALDVESAKSVESKLASQQKNFNIEATKNSNVYVNAWDFNRESFDTQNKNTSLKTDADSRIHFGTLAYDMAKTNYVAKPIDANLSIYSKLTLDNVGKVQAGTQNKLSPSAPMTKDITSDSVLSPVSQQFSESDPLKLAAQAGTSDDRFHALQLQGNASNNGKNLTLENGTRIEVKLDESVKKGDSTNGFQLNKYYTLISAGSITDNRTDKRIYLSFAEGSTPLYWTTLVEDGEVKVKFSEFDPSSYEELSKVIKDDALLKILIEHNPQNDFVQMAGTANQHAELDSYLGVINSDLNKIATSRVGAQDMAMLSFSQSIDTRIAQARYAHSRFGAVRLASNDEKQALSIAYQALQDLKTRNNAWFSVGGGAFAGSAQSMNFYSTNIGYDRLFSFESSDVLLGAMASFGGSSYKAAQNSASSKTLGGALYADMRLQKHEVQSSAVLSLFLNDKIMQGVLGSDSASGQDIGVMWQTYYKYNFEIAQSEAYSHFLKPVALLGVGYNGMGAYEGASYAQRAYNNLSAHLGAGAEYTLQGANASYTLQLLARQNIYNSAKQAFVTLSGSPHALGYTLNPVETNFQLGFIGTSALGRGFSLQYGVAGIMDINGGYGGKGDIRLEYKF